MFRSMTAYGRAHVLTGTGSLLIEIHSVNRKGLDLALNLPKEFLIFDMEIRKEIRREINRGSISVRISKSGNKGEISLPKIEGIKALHQTYQQYAIALGYDPKEAIPFDLLLSQASGCHDDLEESDERLREAILKGVKEALKQLIKMRELEGMLLMADLKPRLEAIRAKLEKVSSRMEVSVEIFKEKLEKRLEEFKLLTEEGQERMMRELILFSEKGDVTEELTRLSSHIEQFEGLLEAKKHPLGRELDFLVQEMNREANTIGSKSQDLEMTQASLAIKAELEKIREQIQNIE
jgi:uncharacterized protein (TIGR00255 family)